MLWGEFVIIISKSVLEGRLEKPETGIEMGIGTRTGTGTGIGTVMERGTYIKIGTTFTLIYFNLDLILI